MHLGEWAVEYVKTRDLIFGTLREIREERDRIIFTFTDHTHTYYIREALTQEAIDLLNSESEQTLVCANTEANLRFLIEHWQQLCSYPHTRLLFVNTRHNMRWGIAPATHNRIADPAKLETGLRSLFESIPPMEQQPI